MLFAERTKDVALAQAALSQINLAFETMRDSGNAPILEAGPAGWTGIEDCLCPR
jgi:hypothetical protein